MSNSIFATWPSGSEASTTTSVVVAASGTGETSRSRPVGRRLPPWTANVRRSLPERPPASVERTATLPEAAAVIVTAAPVASSNAPSPSRSQVCVTPLPGLVALRTTVVPARGAAGWIRIDGDGRASLRAGATAGSAAANASSATAATRPTTIRRQP
jgi:hypothetical protein